MFLSELKKSLISIKSLPKLESKQDVKANNDDSKLVKQLIKQLNQLLEDDNAIAENVINRLITTSAYNQHNDDLESILMEIQDVDYFSASEKLKKLSLKIGE